MTKKQLEKMGVYPDFTPKWHSRYWVNIIQDHITIINVKNITMEEIMKMVYDVGIKNGKSQRSKEFGELLNNVE